MFESLSQRTVIIGNSGAGKSQATILLADLRACVIALKGNE
jgi:ABC-type transport system involved in cytochrome bd biosynthesis fused ATPase/permease subunit